MNRVFGRKKAPGPPAPSLDEASGSVGNQMESMDGEMKVFHIIVSEISIFYACLLHFHVAFSQN